MLYSRFVDNVVVGDRRAYFFEVEPQCADLLRGDCDRTHHKRHTRTRLHNTINYHNTAAEQCEHGSSETGKMQHYVHNAPIHAWLTVRALHIVDDLVASEQTHGVLVSHGAVAREARGRVARSEVGGKRKGEA
jgi:hypothetical protein